MKILALKQNRLNEAKKKEGKKEHTFTTEKRTWMSTINSVCNLTHLMRFTFFITFVAIFEMVSVALGIYYTISWPDMIQLRLLVDWISNDWYMFCINSASGVFLFVAVSLPFCKLNPCYRSPCYGPWIPPSFLTGTRFEARESHLKSFFETDIIRIALISPLMNYLCLHSVLLACGVVIIKEVVCILPRVCYLMD